LRGVVPAAIVLRRVAAETQSTRHGGGVSPTIYVAAVNGGPQEEYPNRAVDEGNRPGKVEFPFNNNKARKFTCGIV
jgi:hypothetical protein